MTASGAALEIKRACRFSKWANLAVVGNLSDEIQRIHQLEALIGAVSDTVFMGLKDRPRLA